MEERETEREKVYILIDMIRFRPLVKTREINDPKSLLQQMLLWLQSVDIYRRLYNAASIGKTNGPSLMQISN